MDRVGHAKYRYTSANGAFPWPWHRFYPQITEQNRHKSPNKVVANHRKFLGNACEPSFLVVVVGTDCYAYQRKDGVFVSHRMLEGCASLLAPLHPSMVWVSWRIRGGQHTYYQLKMTCPGLKSDTGKRLKSGILCDLSATALVSKTCHFL